jgi:hypothetical protein
MIARYDITQGTEDWFRLKYGKIGGSTSKGLFVPSDTLLLEILAEMTEPFVLDDDGYESFDMLRGKELEPLARAEGEKYAGVKFLVPGWLQCEEIPILGISPDGITENETFTFEAKCPGAKRHIETVYNNEIPKDNIHQSLHYFTVNPKCEKHLFMSFRPESAYPMWFKLLTLDSVIDLGTKAKPVCKTIREWVGIAKFNGLELETNLQLALTQLDKI